jgi:hypothetical protein
MTEKGKSNEQNQQGANADRREFLVKTALAAAGASAVVAASALPLKAGKDAASSRLKLKKPISWNLLKSDEK